MVSLSGFHYSAGGLVSSGVLITAAFKAPLDWAFCGCFVAYLAYHLGPQMFEKFLDKWQPKA